LAGNTIFWKAVWQTIVSHSSTESELMALDKGATIGQMITHTVEGMGGNIQLPVQIFVDNQAAIDLSSNPVATGRNLHMHARYFYVRDMINDGVYVVIHLPSGEQIADVLCTYKGGANFEHLLARVMDVAHVVIDAQGRAQWVDAHML
jgi:hypothetical protein